MFKKEEGRKPIERKSGESPFREILIIGLSACWNSNGSCNVERKLFFSLLLILFSVYKKYQVCCALEPLKSQKPSSLPGIFVYNFESALSCLWTNPWSLRNILLASPLIPCNLVQYWFPQPWHCVLLKEYSAFSVPVHLILCTIISETDGHLVLLPANKTCHLSLSSVTNSDSYLVLLISVSRRERDRELVA